MGGVQRAPIFRLVRIAGYFPFTAVPLARNCDIAHPIWRWIPLHTRIILYIYTFFYTSLYCCTRVRYIIIQRWRMGKRLRRIHVYHTQVRCFFPAFFFFFFFTPPPCDVLILSPVFLEPGKFFFFPPHSSVRSTRPRLRLLYRNTLSHRVLSLFPFLFFSAVVTAALPVLYIYTS